MPTLPWRNDADGFWFQNKWQFNPIERGILQDLVAPQIPAAVAAVAAVIPDPILLSGLWLAASNYTALGPLPSMGLCGGMAYLALDHWHARAELPRGFDSLVQPDTTNGGQPLRDRIWQRLMDSLGPGDVLGRTLEWSLLLNQVPAFLGGGPTALLQRTREEWLTVRGEIQAGRPVPVGLVYTGRPLWDQHQVVVYGYEDAGSPWVSTLYVYDSNDPHRLGRPSLSTITLNLSGAAVVATTPSDGTVGTLAGFFRSNYTPASPAIPQLQGGFGRFLSWTNDPTTYLTVDGTRLAIADAAELAELGGVAAQVHTATEDIPDPDWRPRDGALFRERSQAQVWLFQGGAPFAVPNPDQLAQLGGWDAVRVVPDGSVGPLTGLPAHGTLLRELSSASIFVMDGTKRRRITTPAELQQRGGYPTVRVVPDNSLDAIQEGAILPAPTPGECDQLAKRLQDLDDEITTLQRQLDRAVTDIEETRLQTAINLARARQAEARARQALLGCP